jgi:hypothetical protein
MYARILTKKKIKNIGNGFTQYEYNIMFGHNRQIAAGYVD